MRTVQRWVRRRLDPGRWWSMGIAVAFATGVLGTAVPVTAAVVRHASPSGSGTACTELAPCSLPVAIGQAPKGATVRVAGDQGPYVLAAPIEAAGITVVGVNGRPSLVFASQGLILTRSAASNLAIEDRDG